jgi:hypothetical protein
MSDEEWIPGSKAELISAIKREWKALDGCRGQTGGRGQDDHTR